MMTPRDRVLTALAHRTPDRTPFTWGFDATPETVRAECRRLVEVLGEALAQMRLFWGAYDALPTFPETRIQVGGTYLCHGWAGGPAFLLPAYTLGLRPTGPGWSEALFSPQPGDLAHASGTVAIPRGPLTAQWRREQTRYVLRVEMPAGTAVRVKFQGLDIMVRDTPCWETTVEGRR
jgi:hypothetical protein